MMRVSVVMLFAAMLAAPAAHAAPGAHGPDGEHLDAPAAGGSPAGLSRLPDGSVNVPKAAQRRMGILTTLSLESESARTVELSGRIVGDPNASGKVQAVHGGRIEPGPRGLPFAGQPVRKGAVLAYVHHHADPYAVGNQQAQLAELRAQRQIAEQRLKRLESLEGTVPRKDIEAARLDVASLVERERSIAGSLNSREALIAPVSGVVSRVDVTVGQVVDARDTLFEVIDPTRLMVEATTTDAALGTRIGGASLRETPDGKLKFLGAARALRDGVLPLTFSLQSTKASVPMPVAVGQPVTVLVQLTEKVRGFVLPAQSVTRNAANESVVWIKSGTERFIPQPVRFQALGATTIVVTQGLSANNRVVVQGAPLIAQIR